MLCAEGLAGRRGMVASLALPKGPFVMLLGFHVALNYLVHGKLIGNFYKHLVPGVYTAHSVRLLPERKAPPLLFFLIPQNEKPLVMKRKWGGSSGKQHRPKNF